jgi:hypothetical protein
MGMSDEIDWADRRQFGRRPLNAEAVAEIPGGIAVPCIIENISRGGALLHFPCGAAPILHFQLAVEGMPYKVDCEMRHQVGFRFGVRFRHLTDGVALDQFFAQPTSEPANAPLPEPRPTPRLLPPSVRELRQALFQEALQPAREDLEPKTSPQDPQTAPAKQTRPSRPSRLKGKSRKSQS